MIGLDSNVLMRVLTRDDPDQFKVAYKLFQSLSPQEPAWISIANVLELDWVLRSRYGHNRAGVAKILEDLLASTSVVVEQSRTVSQALSLYRTSRADLGECLVVASAHAAGCSKVFTFDKIAARDLGIERLGP